VPEQVLFVAQVGFFSLDFSSSPPEEDMPLSRYHPPLIAATLLLLLFDV